jgi:hypothetical protein
MKKRKGKRPGPVRDPDLAGVEAALRRAARRAREIARATNTPLVIVENGRVVCKRVK